MSDLPTAILAETTDDILAETTDAILAETTDAILIATTTDLPDIETMEESVRALSAHGSGAMPAAEMQRLLDVLSTAAIRLYGQDLRDHGIQFKLAVLGENIMFQRVFYHAQRASLEFALSQVEGKITGVWK